MLLILNSLFTTEVPSQQVLLLYASENARLMSWSERQKQSYQLLLEEVSQVW